MNENKRTCPSHGDYCLQRPNNTDLPLGCPWCALEALQFQKRKLEVVLELEHLRKAKGD